MRSQSRWSQQEQFGNTAERRRSHRLAVETYAVIRALSQAGEPSPSLANCEKVPMSADADDETDRRGIGEADLSEAHATTAMAALRLIDGDPGDPDDVQRAVDMTAGGLAADQAVWAAFERSDHRQQLVARLLEEGETPHARRLATCNRRSIQLECPDEFGAQGCGSTQNYVPMSCDSPLCPDCGARKMGKKAGQFEPVVDNWSHPLMMRLSLPDRIDPEDLQTGVDALRGAFGRLRRRVVPTDGDGWDWSTWKSALMAAGRHDLARRWQKRYVSEGRGIPFSEVVPEGFYGIDIKQDPDRTLNVHMHVLADCAYLPQAALSALWDDVIGAPVVDIRRIDGERQSQGTESAVMEVIGYACKPPEFEELDDEIHYYQTLSGSKLVQPFGELHGNTPDVMTQLRCSCCGDTPAWWNYEGIIDEKMETVEVVTTQGDRPPPQGGSTGPTA